MIAAPTDCIETSGRPSMTEADLLRGVLDMAGVLGWRSAHFRPGRTAHGWRTAVSGDGKGFPDLFLVRGRRLVAAELKAKAGRLTPDQALWLELLAAAGVEAGIWTPADYPDRIAEVLR
jgi:hypothetical protein